MSPTLQRLMMIAPPPPVPVTPGSASDWTRMEGEGGIRLPQDFKDYTTFYGAGRWADFFGVMNPFYDGDHSQGAKTWREWRQTRLEGLETLQQQYPGYVAPFRLHPAPDGLLAIGYDDNGGTLCWQTTRDPDSWRIVCLDGKLSEDYDSFDMTLTGFLAALLSEEIFPRTFPPDFFPIPEPAFRPCTTD